METNQSRIIEKELSYSIVGGFYEVYNEWGFGLIETPYVRALEIVLAAKGLIVEREFPLPLFFRGQQVGFQRFDMLVERRVIVEVKSSEKLPDIAKRQLRSYLTATGLQLGILLHFGPKARYFRVLGPRVTGAA